MRGKWPLMATKRFPTTCRTTLRSAWRGPCREHHEGQTFMIVKCGVGFAAA